MNSKNYFFPLNKKDLSILIQKGLSGDRDILSSDYRNLLDYWIGILYKLSSLIEVLNELEEKGIDLKKLMEEGYIS